jgi:hypothetical protein
MMTSSRHDGPDPGRRHRHGPTGDTGGSCRPRVGHRHGNGLQRLQRQRADGPTASTSSAPPPVNPRTAVRTRTRSAAASPPVRRSRSASTSSPTTRRAARSTATSSRPPPARRRCCRASPEGSTATHRWTPSGSRASPSRCSLRAPSTTPSTSASSSPLRMTSRSDRSPTTLRIRTTAPGRCRHRSRRRSLQDREGLSWEVVATCCSPAPSHSPGSPESSQQEPCVTASEPPSVDTLVHDPYRRGASLPCSGPRRGPIGPVSGAAVRSTAARQRVPVIAARTAPTSGAAP